MTRTFSFILASLLGLALTQGCAKDTGTVPQWPWTEPEPEIPEFVTAVGDDSITRFDTPKKQKRRGGKGQQKQAQDRKKAADKPKGEARRRRQNVHKGNE